MPDLRKDPIVGRWVIVAKNRAKRPHDLIDVVGDRAAEQLLSVLRRQRAAHARRNRRLPPRRHPSRPPRLAGARGAQQFPALEIEGDLNKRGQGMYDMMRGVGAPRGDHRVAAITWSAPPNCRVDSLREVLCDLSRPAGRSEEGLAAGLRHDLQERRRRGRRLAGTHAQPVDRHADRADQRRRGDRRLARLLPLSRAVRVLRHGRAGAGLRDSGSCSMPRVSWPFARLLPAFPSRPGSCPPSMPATTKRSQDRARRSWPGC